MVFQVIKQVLGAAGFSIDAFAEMRVPEVKKRTPKKDLERVVVTQAVEQEFLEAAKNSFFELTYATNYSLGPRLKVGLKGAVESYGSIILPNPVSGLVVSDTVNNIIRFEPKSSDLLVEFSDDLSLPALVEKKLEPIMIPRGYRCSSLCVAARYVSSGVNYDPTANPEMRVDLDILLNGGGVDNLDLRFQLTNAKYDFLEGEHPFLKLYRAMEGKKC
ncbi:hypothetical protein HN587_01130 [Candidatus Woesearchaeota archaeon]|mgnify:CR=1 FL=1|jgi:hypothetical protein|nr:hypothetical protein [Candidatus Woesearchaeota archaeon]